MALTGYVGITIRDDYILEREELDDLQRLDISKHNNCLYAMTLRGDSVRDIERLSKEIPAHQLIHIKNQLKRVKSDTLYAALQDNFGIHVFPSKRQVIVRRR